MKKHKVKEKFLEALEQTPIVQAACERVGISRNTFYRWIKEDSDFRSQVDERMGMGVDLVNDYAESNVLGGIKAGDPGYTKYWLSARHGAYRRPFYIHHNDDEKERKELERRKEAIKEVDAWESQWESFGIPRSDRKYTAEELAKMKELREFLKRNNQKKRKSNL